MPPGLLQCGYVLKYHFKHHQDIIISDMTKLGRNKCKNISKGCIKGLKKKHTYSKVFNID